MNSYEESLINKKNRILAKIEKLKKEKEELKNEPIKAYETYDYIDDIRKNSDTGELENWGKVYGKRMVLGREAKERRDNKISSIEREIQELYSEIGAINVELSKIEWNKPENVAKRQQAELIEQRQKRQEQLDKERIKHEELHKNLNKLIEYLRMAGLRDLARRLSNLRFAYSPKSGYIRDEIVLQIEEETLRREKLLTPKEKRDIKKNVIRLSKDATRTVRRYKDLCTLRAYASRIVHDIENKGISKMQGDALYSALELYFTQPTGKYYFRDYRGHSRCEELENLGYQYLAFYRDPNSKYNEGVRKFKI